MDCMQSMSSGWVVPLTTVSIPQAVWIACNSQKIVVSIPFVQFQYRKRYGLHAILKGEIFMIFTTRFQYRKRYGLHAINPRLNRRFAGLMFQYRKRYGLHAILSPGSLGNSEPKNRVSNDDPLFAFFPKVSGTFLSRKVLRKGLEASHSKGTFVHERNLILMAFSLDFRASLEQSIS